MKLQTFAIVIAIAVIVIAGVPVASGDAFSSPLIYDWIQNETDDEDSHVSNYSIDSPEQYFSGGLSDSRTIGEELNDSVESDNVESSLYRIYDESFQEYPIDPVYTQWNANNYRSYGERPYVPEFKRANIKEQDASGQYKLVQDAWTGIYSVEPASVVHYGPPDENEHIGDSVTVVGDTLTVRSIIGGSVGSLPEGSIDGSLRSEGTLRYDYSVESVDRSAALKITAEEGGLCSDVCTVSNTDAIASDVSGYYAEFSDIKIDDWVKEGANFTVEVESQISVNVLEDVDIRVANQVIVECPEPSDPNDSIEPPCYETEYSWDDYTTNIISEEKDVSDTQQFRNPLGFSQSDINDDIEYNRAVYPNGSSEIEIDTSAVESGIVDDAIWRKITVGDEELVSPWRSWSSRNMSWDYMYKTAFTNAVTAPNRYESHLRPLQFHTAPIRQGITTTNGLQYTQGEFGGIQSQFATLQDFGFDAFLENQTIIQSYDSPELLRHQSCQSEWPEQSNQSLYCGWSFIGAGNDVKSINYEPYYQVTSVGEWSVDSNVSIQTENTDVISENITIHGLAPNSSTEVSPDRFVNVRETTLYSELVSDNFNNASANQNWVEIRFTLTDTETDERIELTDDDGFLVIENTEYSQDGEFNSGVFRTNESGQVTVKIYGVKGTGVQAEYLPEKWYDVEEGTPVYAQSEVSENIFVPSFSIFVVSQYVIAFGTIIYLILYAWVRVNRALGIESSIDEELSMLFPKKFRHVGYWVALAFILFTLLRSL